MLKLYTKHELIIGFNKIFVKISNFLIDNFQSWFGYFPAYSNKMAFKCMHCISKQLNIKIKHNQNMFLSLNDLSFCLNLKMFSVLKIK